MVKALFYSISMIKPSQQIARKIFFYKATVRQRRIAGAVCLASAFFLLFCWLAATNRIDIELILTPCGFKQRHDLPCPTCSMTTSMLYFFKGQILKSFCAQPAAAILACLLVVTAFLTFLIAVFGVYLAFLKRIVATVKVRYVILALLLMILASWAVVLARVFYGRTL